MSEAANARAADASSSAIPRGAEPAMRYAVVIPAKNEEANLRSPLDSLLAQTLAPVACVVVDDGSTDRTSEIVEEYSRRAPVVHGMKRSGDAAYVLGSKIVESFGAGVAHLAALGVAFDWVVKMDADIAFGPEFMEEVSRRVSDGSFGIVSGQPFIRDGAARRSHFSPDWHTNGDFKIYRREFLEQIGGLPRSLGWDTADNILAMERGWRTTVFRDLAYEQRRPIGRHSVLRGRLRQGLGAYKLRYSPAYLALRVLHDAAKAPFVTGALWYLAGYLSGPFRAGPRALTREQARILRKLLWRSVRDRMSRRQFAIFHTIRGAGDPTRAP